MLDREGEGREREEEGEGQGRGRGGKGKGEGEGRSRGWSVVTLVHCAVLCCACLTLCCRKTLVVQLAESELSQLPERGTWPRPFREDKGEGRER